MGKRKKMEKVGVSLCDFFLIIIILKMIIIQSL